MRNPGKQCPGQREKQVFLSEDGGGGGQKTYIPPPRPERGQMTES